MPGSLPWKSLVCVALVPLLACGEQVAAIKAAAELAEKAAEQAEKAEEAEKASEDGRSEAGAAAPSKDAAEAMARLGMTADGRFKGPIAHWRQLIGFLPDRVGGFEAKGEAKGETTRMGEMARGAAFTEVRRSYARGKERVKITIADASFNPALRAVFELGVGMDHDSSEGYDKGTTLGGFPARVEWKASSKHSKATALVKGRYVVSVRVRNAESADAAAKLLTSLDLAGLAAVEPKENP